MEDQDEYMAGRRRLYDVLSLKVRQSLNSAHLHAQLGMVCLELEKREEALSNLKKALRIDPQMDEVKHKLTENFGPEELGDIVHTIEPQPFWKDLGWALSYPLAKEGIIIIVAGAALFSVFNFIPVAGPILIFLIAYPYLAAYILKIIRHSADGDRTLPDWPELDDIWESLMLPAIQFLSATLISFAPVIALFIYGLRFSLSLTALGTLFLIVLFVCCLYYPMAVMATAMYENGFAAINVPLLVRSMVRMKRDYIVAVVFLVLSVIVGGFLMQSFAIAVPFLGPFLFWALNIYFATLQANILGNIYHVNEHKLNWFPSIR